MKNIFASIAIGAAIFGAAAVTTPAQAQNDPRTNINRHTGSFDNTWTMPYNDSDRYGTVNWKRPFNVKNTKAHGWHWKNGKRVYY